MGQPTFFKGSELIHAFNQRNALIDEHQFFNVYEALDPVHAAHVVEAEVNRLRLPYCLFLDVEEVTDVVETVLNRILLAHWLFRHSTSTRGRSGISGFVYCALLTRDFLAALAILSFFSCLSGPLILGFVGSFLLFVHFVENI